MKKISLIISLILIAVIYSCDKYEEVQKSDNLTPEAKQWAFMGEVTSTTCGTCGYSGYNNFNLMKKNNSGKIIALAFHCNYPDDSMQSPLLYSYESSRPTGGGIPSFHVGNNKSSMSDLQNNADSILKKAPEAQVKFKAVMVGSKMNVTSKIKFFKNVTGEYYVSFYLCEHGIDGSPTAPNGYKQSGGSGDYKHNNVVRAGNENNNAYGTKITTAEATTANTIFDYTCSIDINPKWNKSKLFVTAVIWKKNTDNSAECQYLFVNGWDTQVYN